MDCWRFFDSPIAKALTCSTGFAKNSLLYMTYWIQLWFLMTIMCQVLNFNESQESYEEPRDDPSGTSTPPTPAVSPSHDRAPSSVGRAQGLVSHGSGCKPDLFRKEYYMPFSCHWRFEIKLRIFFLSFT
jgi:hypothetical protein